jgi:hypothetical protein
VRLTPPNFKVFSTTPRSSSECAAGIVLITSKMGAVKEIFVKKVLFMLTMAIVASNLNASTIGMEEFTCPVCLNKFEYRVQYSYSTFGQNLDFRPYGAAIIPTPIPKCPNCGFVFAEEMFDKNEIATLKNYFAKDNIFTKEPDMPNYYYLAREYEILKKNLDDIIWFFLCAVWENTNADKKTMLINITIDNINKSKTSDESYNDYQLIKLDLLRQSGNFEKAKELIETIKKDKTFYTDYIIKIIDLQTKLLSEKNTTEHQMPE